MNEYKYLENQNQTMGENSFMKTLLKKPLNQKGLTLIELLAVIVILAIVAAIAIPAIGNIISNSRVKAVKSDAILILNAAQIEYTNDNKAFAAPKEVDGQFITNEGAFADQTYTISVVSNELVLNATKIPAGSKTVTFTNSTIETINAESAETEGSTKVE